MPDRLLVSSCDVLALTLVTNIDGEAESGG